MNLPDLLNLYDLELRRNIEYPDMRKETTPKVVRFVRNPPGMSSIEYSNLDEGDADAEIFAQLAYFRGLKQPFTWKVYNHDRPYDLGQRLLTAGFEDSEADAIMVLEASQWKDLPGSDYRIRRISSREGLGDVVAVLENVYESNFQWVYGRLGAHLSIPDYLEVYAAYVDEQPASVGWVYFPPGTQFATLWAGTTLQQYRRQGLYLALLHERIQAARRQGRLFLTVDAGQMSQPILERRGFRQLAQATDYTWRPVALPSAI